MSRRFVIFHQSGGLKGVPQILGTDEEFQQQQLQGLPLPSSIGPLSFADGHTANARLHRVTPTYVGYIEETAVA